MGMCLTLLLREPIYLVQGDINSILGFPQYTSYMSLSRGLPKGPTSTESSVCVPTTPLNLFSSENILESINAAYSTDALGGRVRDMYVDRLGLYLERRQIQYILIPFS